MVKGIGFLLAVCITLLLASPAGSVESPASLERRIMGLVREAYPDGNDLRVTVERVPIGIREGAEITSLDVVKMPEGDGKGLALIGYRRGGSRTQSSYVPFHVKEKRLYFYAREKLKKGDRLDLSDLSIREAYGRDKAHLYPRGADDVRGKVLKRDIPPGTVITNAVLGEQYAIRRGQSVTLVAGNDRLLVRAPGKAAENGARGDKIRVKSLSSGRELQGKIIDGGTVAVDF